MTAVLTPVEGHMDTVSGTDAELPVIELVEPMPGFPGLRAFALVRLDEAGILCSLRSIDDPELRFLVVPPGLFFPDYAPEIDDSDAAALGIDETSDVLTLVIVNPGDTASSATANLLAPIVVNTATRSALQVVLNKDLPIQAKLVA